MEEIKLVFLVLIYQPKELKKSKNVSKHLKTFFSATLGQRFRPGGNQGDFRNNVYKSLMDQGV